MRAIDREESVNVVGKHFFRGRIVVRKKANSLLETTIVYRRINVTFRTPSC